MTNFWSVVVSVCAVVYSFCRRLVAAAGRTARRALILSAHVGRQRLRAVRAGYRTRRDAVSAYLLKLYIHYFVHEDLSAKCPACGHRRKHKVVWSPHHKWPSGEVGALLHECPVDGAVWARPPLVEAKAWRVEMIAQDLEEQVPGGEQPRGVMRVV